MYVQLFRRASCALPQQQEVLVWKIACRKEIVLLFLNVLIQNQNKTHNSKVEKPLRKQTKANLKTPTQIPQKPKKKHNEVFILGVV